MQMDYVTTKDRVLTCADIFDKGYFLTVEVSIGDSLCVYLLHLFVVNRQVEGNAGRQDKSERITQDSPVSFIDDFAETSIGIQVHERLQPN